MALLIALTFMFCSCTFLPFFYYKKEAIEKKTVPDQGWACLKHYVFLLRVFFSYFACFFHIYIFFSPSRRKTIRDNLIISMPLCYLSNQLSFYIKTIFLKIIGEKLIICSFHNSSSALLVPTNSTILLDE